MTSPLLAHNRRPAAGWLPPGLAGACRRIGTTGVAASMALLAAMGTAQADEAPDWTFAGRMGIVQYVVVPESQARERAYYDRIIESQCGEASRCFLRFFTNSTGAEVALPLPDVIGHEATALYQRSDKRGGADFRWACRLKISTGDCF